MPPGCTANTRTPLSRKRASSPTVNQTLAVFGLTVRLPFVVRAVFKLRIGKIHHREFVPGGGQIDHPRGGAALEGRRKQTGQQKVADMIRRELRFPTGFGARQRTGHDARVVDQNVQRQLRGKKRLRKGAHAAYVDQIQRCHSYIVVAGVGTNISRYRLALSCVKDRQPEASACLGECSSGCYTNTRGGPGDGRHFAADRKSVV